MKKRLKPVMALVLAASMMGSSLGVGNSVAAGGGVGIRPFNSYAEEIEREEVNTSDTDNPETSDTDNPETPETDNPETPDTDNPETPETDNPETPDIDNPETPETDNPETPDIDNPGTPETDNPETPDTDAPETPDADAPETPDADAPDKLEDVTGEKDAIKGAGVSVSLGLKEEKTATPSEATKATPSEASRNNSLDDEMLERVIITYNDTPVYEKISETDDSFMYLSQKNGRTKQDIGFTDKYNYKETEYFLKGKAHVYDLKDDHKVVTATSSNATRPKEQDYVNRVFVYMPEESADFNGVVFVDILNASSKVDLPDIWRRSYDYFMRNGYAYVGITSKYCNVESLKKFDSKRYAELEWGASSLNDDDRNGLFWDMLGQLGVMLKQQNCDLLGGNTADKVFLMGQSQSGMYLNTFVNCFGQANAVGIDYNSDEGEGDAVFDGFVNVVGAFADSALSSGGKTRSFAAPYDSPVPYILVEGENDYSACVKINPNYIKEDGDEPGENMYRHYVIAGGAHSSKIFPPDLTDELQIQAGRPAGYYPAMKTDKDTGRPNTNTDLNMDSYVNSVLANLIEWTDGGDMPAGFRADDIGLDARDDYGNLTEGIVPPQISVPVAKYYGGVNGNYSTDGGSMVYISREELEDLYADREDYLDQYESALDDAIAEGYLIEEERERMMSIAENQPIFGYRPSWFTNIEESMKSEPSIMMVGDVEEKDGYKESIYKVSGTANIYGVLLEDIPYIRKPAQAYTNYVRVCIPDNFNGKAVIGLISNNDTEFDITKLKAKGIAYIGITADADAAEKYGCSWKVLEKEADPTRQENGLIWDIISQTASLSEKLLGQNPSKLYLGIKKADNSCAYTYTNVFKRFYGFKVDAVGVDGLYEIAEPKKLMVLNDIDSTIPVASDDSVAAWYDSIIYRENGNGPTIGATAKSIIEQDGMYFKDSNGNGILDVYEDWREDDETRAKDLVEKMTLQDKAGMMVINSRGMGIYSSNPDEATGLLDETSNTDDMSSEIFGVSRTLGTTEAIVDWGLRHFILRQNPEPEDMASWINQMNLVAEKTELGIPVVVASNSRNENGQMTFGMNDASGVFSTWPGTLGLAAAVMGDIARGGDAGLISRFAEIARNEWDASGLKKGYMYMADTMTDPRWQRTYGTFGEDPELISDIIGRLVEGFQNGSDGVQADGVALTVKHFPGGGARENGFDPHYSQGQWNVYQTEGSLEKYHLPAFIKAVENRVSSIMPYYAKPAAEKSETQYDLEGNPIDMVPVGFAFNKVFINDILREQIGHEGYVNSDSGITGNMCWGVEELDVPERNALAINVGTDIISDTNDVNSIIEAWNRGPDGGKSDYYTTEGVVPAGYEVADVTLTTAALDQSNVRLLKEMFDLGLFENPYRDPDTAQETVDNQDNWDEAYEAHQKSVVLLKDGEGTLPLTADKLTGKKVYIQYFGQSNSASTTSELQRSIMSGDYNISLTNNYHEADYALLFVNPSSGNYFSATKGYLELDICTDKIVHDVDDEGRPVADTHTESTIENVESIKAISEAVRANGGKVVTNVNFTLAWMLGNVEPYSDVVLAGFDTLTTATMDVITGVYEPAGKMPITLPKDDSVIAVNADGVCISPNDVPGYDKDQYMPASMKDENGKAYAYKDSEGNYYELGFGLTYVDDNEEEPVVPTPGENGGSSGSSGSGGSGNGGRVYTSSSNTPGAWHQDEKGWWFEFTDKSWPHGEWRQLVWNNVVSWYYFHEDGYMATGWFRDGDHVFYLHPYSDGTQGYMYVGWHQIDGKWYYFNEVSDGTLGKLLTNTWIDGWYVDNDGVWNGEQRNNE